MSNRSKQIKTLLFIAIGVVLLSTTLLKRHLTSRRAELEANRPEVRLRRATDDARLAALNGRLSEAIGHLKAARGIIDEAIAEAPRDIKLLTARLALARRRLKLMERAGLKGDGEIEEIERLSAALLDAFPADEAARRARLEIALERGEGADRAAAARALRGGLEAVEATIQGLRPSDAVRVGLGSGWLKLAELSQAAGDKAATSAALAQVRRHGAALAEGDDPVSGLRTQHSLLSSATQIAEAMALAIFPELLQELLGLLKLKRKLQGDKAALSALAYWTGIAADHAEADEARAATYAEALELRRALLELDPTTRADLLRLLNRVAVFHGRAGRFEVARAHYEEAISLSEGHEDIEVQGLRLFILGNLAQLLGKHDQMKAAKQRAEAAYALGQALRVAHPDDAQIQLRAAVAGLRHARLLRATPQPRRAEALKIARQTLTEAEALKADGERVESLKVGLKALIDELR
ncbi:hypothetical protein KKB55_12070 [Myxococcota bacterium]|nr:hypothetical protein [Myxococcota bacterium]MBU1898476.1 hypothetical protein [Myxococcota bacterium]